MIIYNGKSSLTDFDIYIATKEIPVPSRKVITETVPYMSGIWDFSYHDGVDEYDAITLKYTFDVIADTKQELSAQKTALLAWAHEYTDGKLYDTDVSFAEYWQVYRAQASWSENWLQGLLTIEFTCYPFRKTEPQLYEIKLEETEKTVIVKNDGYRAITPALTVTETAVVNIGANAYTFSAGVFEDILKLEKGENTLVVSGTGSISFNVWAEVL